MKTRPGSRYPRQRVQYLTQIALRELSTSSLAFLAAAMEATIEVARHNAGCLDFALLESAWRQLVKQQAGRAA